MQTEVGEALEPAAAGRGGSSTLPHKRNPVAAAAVAAAHRRAGALVSVMLGAMAQEHERAVGGWQAEWETLTDLLRAAGGVAAHVGQTLRGLEIDPAAMARNLGVTGGVLLSERIVLALAPSIGRAAATAAVQAAAARAATSGRGFAEELLEDPAVAGALAKDAGRRTARPARLPRRRRRLHRPRPRRAPGPLMPSVEHEGAAVAYRVDGPPSGARLLLLANSLGTTTAMWDDQIGALAQRFLVIRYDHRGHGGSTATAGPVHDRVARRATRWRSSMQSGCASASVCGLSLGGAVALWIAVARPGPGRAAGRVLQRAELRRAPAVGGAGGPGPGRRGALAARPADGPVVHPGGGPGRPGPGPGRGDAPGSRRRGVRRVLRGPRRRSTSPPTWPPSAPRPWCWRARPTRW